MYILHAETFDSADETQLKIIKSAGSYLSLFPMDDHLQNIWGTAISNSELCSRFDEIAHDFYKGGKECELSLALKILDCKFYYHEFVKRLVLLYANLDSSEEVDYGRIKKFLNTLINDDVLSKSQLEVGVINGRHQIAKNKNFPKAENMKKLQEECLSQIKFKNE